MPTTLPAAPTARPRPRPRARIWGGHQPLRAPAPGSRPAVFFAGEATCAAYTGYIHGAYWSGLAAARRVLVQRLGASDVKLGDEVRAASQSCDDDDWGDGAGEDDD